MLRSLSRAPFDRWDYALAAVLVVVAGAIAVMFLRDVGAVHFFQFQMSAGVMFACGREFAQPTVLPQPLYNFLWRLPPRSVWGSQSFDCSLLAGVTGTRAAGPMVQTHLYLFWAVTALWRVFGVSYQSLGPLLAVLHGAYAAGGFILGRLFFGRWAALLLGLALAVSPISVSMLFNLRDYAKAPFIIWSIVLLVLAVRERRATRLVIISLVLGAIIGVGTGFRSDVMIMFPVALGILAFGLSWKRTRLVVRFAAVAAFLCASLGLALPPLSGTASGGLGFNVMEGATTPFRDHLGLGPVAYDFGNTYLDELTLAGIASDLRRPDPARYDAAESRPLEGLTQALTRSTTHMMGWLPLFVGDVATQGLKSGILIAGFPALLAPERRNLDPYTLDPLVGFPAQTAVVQATYAPSQFFARPWMPVIGILGLFTFLLRIFARCRREAACVAVAIGVLLIYPSVLFSMRHFFYMETIFWLALFSLFAAALEWKMLRAHLRVFALWAGALATVVGFTYLALVTFQDYRLSREIKRLLESPKEIVTTTASVLPSGQTLFTVPVPTEHAAIISSRKDSLGEWTVQPYDVRAESDRLLIEIGGPGCAPGPLLIKLSYWKGPLTFEALDRTLLVPAPGSETERTILVTPAFYRPTQHFQGLEVAASQAACLAAVYRVRDSTRLPALFTAVLRPDWNSRALHLKLVSF